MFTTLLIPKQDLLVVYIFDVNSQVTWNTKLLTFMSPPPPTRRIKDTMKMFIILRNN